MDTCATKSPSATSGTDVPLRETSARFVDWPRLSMHLVEHQALARSTGVPWCGHLRLPLGAPPGSRPAPSLVRIGRPSRPTSAAISELRDLLDLAYQRFLGPSHLLNNCIVRLRLSYGERSVLQHLSNWIIRVDHANVSRIPRYYGQVNRPEPLIHKARRC